MAPVKLLTAFVVAVAVVQVITENQHKKNIKNDINLNPNFTIQMYFGLSIYVLIYNSENIFSFSFNRILVAFFYI